MPIWYFDAMNSQKLPVGRIMGWCVSLMAATLLLGCATSSPARWDHRIGTYSWEDAVAELGPPDRVTEETGGVKVAEWIQSRTEGMLAPSSPSVPLREQTLGTSNTSGTVAPAKILRLSFTPDGKLLDWHTNY